MTKVLRILARLLFAFSDWLWTQRMRLESKAIDFEIDADNKDKRQC